MQETTGRDPFVTFYPSRAKFFLVEVLSMLVSIAVGGAVLYWIRGTMDRTAIPVLVGMTIALAIKAAFGLRSRRIVISDRWITGPSGFGSTRLDFATVDRDSIDFTGKRLRVGSIGGDSIAAKISWYTREDIEEVQRLIRDRCATTVS